MSRARRLSFAGCLWLVLACTLERSPAPVVANDLEPAPSHTAPSHEALEHPQSGRPSDESPEAVVEIPVIVRQYRQNASWSHYEDGAFEVHDATALEVDAPHPSAGQSISIFHDAPLDEGSPWRHVGGRYVLVGPTAWFEPQGGRIELASGGVELREREDVQAPTVDQAPPGGTAPETITVIRRRPRPARAGGIPKVRVAEPTVGPAYPADVVRRVMRASVPKLRTCYEGLEASHPDARGRGDLRFTIGPGGEVVAVDLQIGFDAPDFTACVVEVIRATRFPAHPGGGRVQITYPLVFIPEGDPTAADLRR